jgi:hypothetical protein
LLRLATSKTSFAPAMPSAASLSGAPRSASGFDATVHGLPTPDAHEVEVAGSRAHAVWRPKRVAVLTEGADPAPWVEKGVQIVHWSSEAEPQAQAVMTLKQWLA